MGVGMVVMDMEAMASVRLSQAMVVLLFIPMVAAALSTEPLKVLPDMVVMDMVVSTARGLLMLDTMVVLALMSTRPVLTTMDLTDMVSTTTARGQLMLDILVMEVMEDMEWLAVTSKLTGHTLPMVSVLPTLTK